MEQDYLIEVHKGDGPNGAHMYEFIGGQTFGHPNLDVYGELFESCTDPITGDSIADTVQSFKEDLSVQTTDDLLDADSDDLTSTDDDSNETEASGGLSAFSDDDDDSDEDWTELHETLHERLSEAVDDKRVTSSDKSEMHLEHLLGISPIEYYTDDDRGLSYVRKERPRQSNDKRDTIMHPSHSYWGDKSAGQVESAVKNAFQDLLAAGKFVADEEPDCDDYYLYVTPLSE